MKRIYWLSALALLVYGCDATRSTAPDSAIQPNAAAAVAPRPWVQETIIDYAGPRFTHAGPGPHPTTESDKYSLLSGGLRWFSGGTVEYRIIGTTPSGSANNAVEAGEEAWDVLIAARDFTRKDNTSQVNPCTDLPSTIAWASIDGDGGILGVTSPCYNLLTKELVGFSITLDTDDSWGTSGALNLMDVGNVATHEFGHAVGLGHVSAPRDGCLTMYKFATWGEIQKRTPGLGDKLGMAALYANTNVSAGTCGS